MQKIRISKLIQEIKGKDKKIRNKALSQLLSFTKGYKGLYKLDKELYDTVIKVIETHRESKKQKVIEKYSKNLGGYKGSTGKPVAGVTMIPNGITL